jgi:hypothetical protein
MTKEELYKKIDEDYIEILKSIREFLIRNKRKKRDLFLCNKFVYDVVNRYEILMLKWHDDIREYPKFKKFIKAGAKKYASDNKFNFENPWFSASNKDRLEELDKHIKEIEDNL